MIGAVSLVALFALERAMVSESWRRWIYMLTGLVAVTLALLALFGVLQDWPYSNSVYAACIATSLFWIWARRWSDNPDYADGLAATPSPVADGPSPSMVFKSQRSGPRKEAAPKPGTLVFISRHRRQ
ncbi:MAG: hypothetical protein HRU32_08585 [Rhodobacteraceae bacterium]|nr:hypothetical protein [Paracoccaceae bacterium]